MNNVINALIELDATQRLVDELPEPTFKLIKVSDLKFKPPSFLIHGILEADSLALIFGDPGCGKSFIGIDLACCIATGKDFHGHKTKQGAVVYIAGEGHNGLKRRFKAWEIARGQSLDNAPLFVSLKPAALCDEISAREVANAVDQTATKPKLVIIDTVARNFGPGDENNTRDMNQFIAAADLIRSKHKCTVLLIHHTGHADKTRARGAMALKGALDAEYRMSKDALGTVVFESTKMKDATPPDPMAFKLSTVELGLTDEDGNDVTSAVFTKTAYLEPEAPSRAGTGKNQEIAVSLLKLLYGEHKNKLERAGHDPADAKVLFSDWGKACKENMNRQAFQKVKVSLEKNGSIKIEHGYVLYGQ